MLDLILPAMPRQGARHDQAGVTLIEVLVAMIVLSFGILTAVGLQLVSKRNNIDSRQQMSASTIVYDLVERMRVNNTPDALLTYQARAEIGGGTLGASAPSPNCRSTTCFPPQLATYDLWEIERAMDGNAETISSGGTTTAVGGLNSPTACITGAPGGAGGIYSVTIAWRGGTSLPNNVANDCGAGSGKYGDSDEFRRTLTIQAYL